jgi:hypothetical protein
MATISKRSRPGGALTDLVVDDNVAERDTTDRPGSVLGVLRECPGETVAECRPALQGHGAVQVRDDTVFRKEVRKAVCVASVVRLVVGFDDFGRVIEFLPSGAPE